MIETETKNAFWAWSYSFIYTVGINTLDENGLNTAVSSTNILEHIGKYFAIALKLS